MRLLLVVAATLLMSGCSHEPKPFAGDAAPSGTPVGSAPEITPPSGKEFLGRWQWIETTTPVERIAPADPTAYTLEFQTGGALLAQLDCNKGRGSWSVGLDGRGMTLGAVATTRMSCPAGSLDTRFGQDLARVASWSVRGDELWLALPVDSGTLRFRRLP